MNDGESEEKLRELRKEVGKYNTLVYWAVREGMVSALPREGQILAKAIQDHLELPHIHNALEFGDVLEGEAYIVDGASPIAHLYMHAAVEGMVEAGNPDIVPA